jgi:hypothetical protein
LFVMVTPAQIGTFIACLATPGAARRRVDQSHISPTRPIRPSGGQLTHIEVRDFLSIGEHAPEQQALLRLISSLTEGRFDDEQLQGPPQPR